MKMRLPSQRGMTLIEITIVLTAIAILTAIAAPVASRSLDTARLTRAVSDETAIKTSLLNFLSELPGYQGPVVDGTSTSSSAVQMLVSDGDIPREVGPTGDSLWQSVVDSVGGGTLIVDFMENHLVMNQPFGDSSVAYPTSGASAWRGAYLSSPVDPDPWGNRYAVNTEFLQGTAADKQNDVFVLSSGPDEQIDTAFQVDGITPGDDDIITVVRRDAGLTTP